MPSLDDLGAVPGWLGGSVPYAATGAIVLTMALAWTITLTRRHRTTIPEPAKPAKAKTKSSIEDRLTFLVAVIIAGVCAQGMGKFFHDKLNFPLELVIVVGGVLELTAFTCALRARRSVLDGRSAGVDGIAVWVVTALSGVFAAMDAGSKEVALFRLVMPLLAAWLWERGMSIERQRVRGGKTIHWRVTPERILVRLGLAETTDRSAFEVDAHRRLTKVAKAAMRVRSLRDIAAREGRQKRALARLHKAMERAVTHSGLATDPTRQRALLAQLGALYHAATLVDLDPRAPWTGTTPEQSAADIPQPDQPAIPQPDQPAIPAPDQPVVTTPWGGLAIGAPTGPLTGPANGTDRSGTNPAGGSETHEADRSGVGSETSQTHRSQTQVPDPNGDGSETHKADRSVPQVPDLPDPKVPDPTPNRSDEKTPDQVPATRSRTRKTQTGPKKRTRSKPKPLDRLDEAIAADNAYRADHGRHIPAEKLAKALRIGKPAALELVKQVRGGHLDVAK